MSCVAYVSIPLLCSIWTALLIVGIIRSCVLCIIKTGLGYEVLVVVWRQNI